MSAPLGNKFAVGNNGGRPPIYNNVSELQKECDGYFEYTAGEFHVEDRPFELKNGTTVIDKVKVWDRMPEPLTITGLALYLGFCGRQGLYDYESKEEFSFIIKRAMAKVEQGYEFGLSGTSPTGAIFALKNMKWKDKQEMGLTDKDGNDAWNVTLNVSGT